MLTNKQKLVQSITLILKVIFYVYFKINNMPKMMAKVTCAYTIFSH